MTSSFTRVARRLRASPRLVVPEAEKSGTWREASSVRGVTCLAFSAKVMMLK